jgi:predicted metalloprotease with PDZ domain
MTAPLASFLLGLTVLMTLAAPAASQTVSTASGAPIDPLRYTVSFPAPQTHYAEIRVVVPTSKRPVVELMMPVWTPGSYLVRELERHVEAVAATGDGRMLPVEKSQKNRWIVTTGGAQTITMSYRVYGREMSVRTNWIDAGFALLNGAATFMTLTDNVIRPHEVTIVPARGWARSMTGLEVVPGVEHRYRAADFDTLVDSPILIGNPAVYEFTLDGKRHYLVNEGEAGVFDGARAAKDLEAIVREYRRMWGSLPYDKYLFLNVMSETGGGLEHRNSTVLMTSRWATRTHRAYLSWLELASHEFVHVWNVKRLRPVELGPFDYEQEAYTRSLWIAEGITDYYADLALHRAGLSTREELLAALSAKIDALQTTPGRLVQSVEQASFDAWIKYYRPDENSSNTSVSYYTKGAVLGFLLDAKIRNATGGARSLDDVMMAAHARYSGQRGFTGAEFRTVAEQVAGVSLAPFWETGVQGTAELDYSEALDTLGLRFRPSAQGGGRPLLGVTTRNDAGRLVISQVRRDSPAHTAGLNVDDEILAIDEFRVRADRLENRLEQYKPGDRISVLVARREQLQRIEVTLGTEPARAWRLDVNPSAPERAARIRDRWLQPPR